MIFFKIFTVATRVVQQVSVGPAVVLNPGVGWLCTMIYAEIGKGGSDFHEVLQYFDQLKLACSER